MPPIGGKSHRKCFESIAEFNQVSWLYKEKAHSKIQVVKIQRGIKEVEPSIGFQEQ
jgi:hypothetical protein